MVDQQHRLEVQPSFLFFEGRFYINTDTTMEFGDLVARPLIFWISPFIGEAICNKNEFCINIDLYFVLKILI